MGIVTDTKFNDEREQAQSSARGISYQIPARNYDKESDNQHAKRGQCVFRMVCCCRSTPGELYTQGNAHRESSYPHYTVLNLAGIEFSMS